MTSAHPCIPLGLPGARRADVAKTDARIAFYRLFDESFEVPLGAATAATAVSRAAS